MTDKFTINATIATVRLAMMYTDLPAPMQAQVTPFDLLTTQELAQVTEELVKSLPSSMYVDLIDFACDLVPFCEYIDAVYEKLDLYHVMYERFQEQERRKLLRKRNDVRPITPRHK